ncbi:MAG: hypothetical protein LBI01_06885 [Elusimicrobium sp.]|nr:hypothetical protein [Elusimicrobium sp.]
MNRIGFLFLIIILAGCVSYNVEKFKPNEYGLDDSFTGKIFSIDCDGNDFVGAKKVDNKCRKYMSKFAYEKGYYYFTVINQNTDSHTSVSSYTTSKPVTTYSNVSIYSGGRSAYGTAYSTSYVPQTHYYNNTKYSSTYLFILIEEQELQQWSNYYKVSDYYTPKQN